MSVLSSRALHTALRHFVSSRASSVLSQCRRPLPRAQLARYFASTGARPISSTSARRAYTPPPRPPATPAQLLESPSPASLDELEIDHKILKPPEASLQLTARAAEQLRTIAQREKTPSAGLRIAVESGGCHGYQYRMDLARARRPDDYHLGLDGANVYVDAVSMDLLKGAVVDYATELIGSSFRILENPQAAGSGCGCGVSWELKVDA